MLKAMLKCVVPGNAKGLTALFLTERLPFAVLVQRQTFGTGLALPMTGLAALPMTGLAELLARLTDLGLQGATCHIAKAAKIEEGFTR